jgi:hypothetical protein
MLPGYHEHPHPKEKVMNKTLRLLATTLVLACALGIITAAIGWLLHWNTPTQFSNGFFGAGAILIVLGVLSVMGGYGMRSDFKLLYSQSAGDMNTLERSKRWIADMAQGYGAFVFLLLAGVYLVGFAILIPNIF